VAAIVAVMGHVGFAEGSDGMAPDEGEVGYTLKNLWDMCDSSVRKRTIGLTSWVPDHSRLGVEVKTT
jgi:hypothetical protein